MSGLGEYLPSSLMLGELPFMQLCTKDCPHKSKPHLHEKLWRLVNKINTSPLLPNRRKWLIFSRPKLAVLAPLSIGSMVGKASFAYGSSN